MRRSRSRYSAGATVRRLWELLKRAPMLAKRKLSITGTKKNFTRKNSAVAFSSLEREGCAQGTPSFTSPDPTSFHPCTILPATRQKISGREFSRAHGEKRNHQNPTIR